MILHYLWAFPTTCVGLPFVLLAWAGRGEVHIVQGVVEVQSRLMGYLLRTLVPLPGGAAALTLGHVVLGRDRAALDRCREHERVHVRQCERWGPFFIPAYLLASLVAYLRGGHAYWDNPFEREAYAQAEGVGA